MTSDELRDGLRARGGASTIWLLYLADVMRELEAGHPVLTLQRAFFTRGGAYAHAEHLRSQRQWQHYYVFRVAANTAWLDGDVAREAEYETAFGRPRRLPLPGVIVTPTQVAGAMET